MIPWGLKLISTMRGITKFIYFHKLFLFDLVFRYWFTISQHCLFTAGAKGIVFQIYLDKNNNHSPVQILFYLQYTYYNNTRQKWLEKSNSWYKSVKQFTLKNKVHSFFIIYFKSKINDLKKNENHLISHNS